MKNLYLFSSNFDLKRFIFIQLLIALPFCSGAQQSTGKGTICKDTIFDRYLAIYYSGNSILQFNSKGECSSFVNNITKPSGMVISGNIVYVAENKNHIKGFRLNDGSLVFETVIENSGNLNGLTTDNDSLLYSFDIEGNRLYKVNFHDSTYKPIGEISNGADFKYDEKNKRIIFCTNKENKKVLTYNVISESFDTLFFLPARVSECEGLEIDTCGNIFVSAYDHVFHFNKKDGYIIHDLLQCINDNVYMMLDQAESKMIIAANNWTKLLKYDIGEFYAKQGITNQTDLLEQSFNENKMSAVGSLYDENAFIMEPEKTFQARKQIEEYWTQYQDNGESLVIETAILDSSFDGIKYQPLYMNMKSRLRGWSSLNISTDGVFYMLGISKIKTQNEPLSVRDFIMLWKKDSTGRWKIMLESYVPEGQLYGLRVTDDFRVNCYPNPVSKVIFFKFHNDDQTYVRIEISDMNGRVVKSFVDRILQQGDYTIKMPAEDLNNGIYNCCLIRGSKPERVKFIVHK